MKADSSTVTHLGMCHGNKLINLKNLMQRAVSVIGYLNSSNWLIDRNFVMTLAWCWIRFYSRTVQESSRIGVGITLD